MKVETIEIFGFISAIRALRLPFKSEGDSCFGPVLISPIIASGCAISNTLCSEWAIKFGEKDLKLIQRLILNGDEHAKVVRGINVICSIIAPRYWWQEMDTYRVGTERLCSESTMHIEARGLSGKELQKVKGELKESHKQERIQMFSYQTLRRIYFQRITHRLPEWEYFCKWIESLPYAKELIIIREE